MNFETRTFTIEGRNKEKRTYLIFRIYDIYKNIFFFLISDTILKSVFKLGEKEEP